jgi:[methyl-Co(III) methanol-specific corrinoid protein]:coenzyme M methyltransferase
MSRARLLQALTHQGAPGCPAFGTGTSIACVDLMARANAFFPQAHLDAQTMARLAITGHSILGFDVVMPLYSVCHEAAAMGVEVNWGGPTTMPTCGAPIFRTADDIHIPANFLAHPAIQTPLHALSLLKQRLGDDAAVCGKVFGPWTQAYHYFGIENFLVGTIDDPAGTARILDLLLSVTLRFAQAQIDAGADCLLLADHATRDLCSPDAYRTFLEPIHTRLAAEVGCPLILHICGNTSDRVGDIAATSLPCFHWDTRSGPPAAMRQLAGRRLALMGGISNSTLQTTPLAVAEQARAAASHVDILGPECAIPLTTPLDNLRAITSALTDM